MFMRPRSLDAFEPAPGGVWFLKLRGATLVHHALNPVNQSISLRTQKTNKSRNRRGRRAHYHDKNQISATFIGFALLQNFQPLTFNKTFAREGKHTVESHGHGLVLSENLWVHEFQRSFLILGSFLNVCAKLQKLSVCPSAGGADVRSNESILDLLD